MFFLGGGAHGPCKGLVSGGRVPAATDVVEPAILAAVRCNSCVVSGSHLWCPLEVQVHVGDQVVEGVVVEVVDRCAVDMVAVSVVLTVPFSVPCV